ncbi:hypothetical protein HQ590_12965 [bacterium]|nr:hypothetical protein [bacterium]
MVAKSLLACLYVAAVGMGYVWNKNQIYRLGDDLKQREIELIALEKRNAMLAAHLAQLQSPAQLEARNQQLQLGLVAPRQDQLVPLFEPGPEWARPVTPIATARSARNPSSAMMVRR